MRPKDASPNIVFGAENTGWFSRLYEEARKSTFTFSVIGNVFESVRSILFIPGARNVESRGLRLPNVKSRGCAKACVLK